MQGIAWSTLAPMLILSAAVAARGQDKPATPAEQYELLHLTFLRSRTAVGNSGRWQALTFSRRGKIILGVGSVSGRRDGECSGENRHG